MMKRGMVDKQGESMVASYRYLGVSNTGLQMLGRMSVMFPIRPHSSIPEGFLHSIFSGLRRILGSWNLVNPLLRMNEAWMGECAARLQPLVDQYKKHQTFAIEKIPRFDRNNPIMSWGQKNLFKGSVSKK